MRETTLPTLYVALGSLEAGMATLVGILSRAGLGSLFSPTDLMDEHGEVRTNATKVLPLADLKAVGFVGQDWPDQGHVRLDLIVHRHLLVQRGAAVVDANGHVTTPAQMVDLGPHADACITLRAPAPWTAKDLPSIFHQAELAAGPAIIDRPEDAGGPVPGFGNPTTVVVVDPVKPLHVYPTELPVMPVPAPAIPWPPPGAANEPEQPTAALPSEET